MIKRKRQYYIDKVIYFLDQMKKYYPDQEIIFEGVDGSAYCKLKDALIYDGMGGEIVIDAG